MNRALGLLLLLALQSGAFQINLSVDSDGSYYTFSWQPDNNLCNEITIKASTELGSPAFSSAMSTGQYAGRIPGDTLVNRLKGGNTLGVDVDVTCSSNPSLGTLTENHFSLSLTNGNSAPVVVKSGSADSLPAASTGSTSQASTSTSTHTSSQTDSPSSPTFSASSSSPSTSSTSTTTSHRGPPTGSPSSSSSTGSQSNSSATAPATADSSSSSPSPTLDSAINSSSSGKKSNNVGAIAGGVVGGVVALLLLLALVLFLLKRRRRRRYEDEALGSPDAFDPRRKTIQRAWDEQMGYAMGQAEEKTRAATATPDAAFRGFNDSQPSHKGLLENIDEHGYPMDKTPSRWGTPEVEVPSYRRESFQSEEDGRSSLFHADHTDEATTPRWDPNRFVRSPSPH